MVYSVFVLGFLSFIVWAHHMFLTGMGTTISAFFQATTMIISIPSVVILSVAAAVALRRIDPLQHADALRAGVPADVRPRRPHRPAARPGRHRHPAARHQLRRRALPLLVAPGTIFALFAGVYYWFPKITGRMMNETLGRDALRRARSSA